VNTQSSLANQLTDKDYRDAFVASQIRIGLPMQCRALRESREWTQPTLAKAAGMSQPRISEIERPGERKLNIDTLLRIASAFDVALQVRFVPFSKFIDDDDSLQYDSYYVTPFEEDMENLALLEQQMKTVTVLRPSKPSLISHQFSGPTQAVKPFADLQVQSKQNPLKLDNDLNSPRRMREEEEIGIVGNIAS
jgi:transcriptional regulator with XRE-family HTH domain